MLGRCQYPYLPKLSPVFMQDNNDLGRIKQTLCFCNGKAMGFASKSYGFIDAMLPHAEAGLLRAEVMVLHFICDSVNDAFYESLHPLEFVWLCKYYPNEF